MNEEGVYWDSQKQQYVNPSRDGVCWSEKEGQYIYIRPAEPNSEPDLPADPNDPYWGSRNLVYRSRSYAERLAGLVCFCGAVELRLPRSRGSIEGKPEAIQKVLCCHDRDQRMEFLKALEKLLSTIGE